MVSAAMPTGRLTAPITARPGQTGQPSTLDEVLRRQRAHLLRELRGLAEARKQARPRSWGC